jgi:hypothetical protein
MVDGWENAPDGMKWVHDASVGNVIYELSKVSLHDVPLHRCKLST